MFRTLALGTLLAATLIASGCALAQPGSQADSNSPAKPGPDYWQPPFGE